MAAEGARLTQFNTPMPVLRPDAGLAADRPLSVPLRHDRQSRPGRRRRRPTPSPCPPTRSRSPQLLKQAGYATGMVGKWHLGHQQAGVPADPPRVRRVPRHPLQQRHAAGAADRRREGRSKYPVVQATLTKRYTERALRFIERNRDRPFFLYLAHAMPHKPLACSEEFYKKSGAGLYGDVMAELDASVGQVLAKLKELGLDERTLVVFTSDNGPWYGGSTGGLRGMKGTTWEGGYRVPCIARWPGRIPAGTVSHEPAVTMDLFATALAAAGVAPPDGRVIDGKDLLPLLDGTRQEPARGHLRPPGGAAGDGPRRPLEAARPAGPRPSRRRRPGERWIDPRGPDGVTILAPYEQSQPTEYPGLRTGDETKAMSLFDLANDPGEQHDVAAEHPDVVARLKARYDEMSKEVPASARTGE